jgi:hypothetical protein
MGLTAKILGGQACEQESGEAEIDACKVYLSDDQSCSTKDDDSKARQR